MNYSNSQSTGEINNPEFARISNLIFVDASLGNDSSLIPDTSNSEVIVLNSQFNGVEQISQALDNYSNLDSIQIISHGDAGLVQLGDTFLSNNNIDLYQDDLQAWGQALSPEGDLLFYGCNVAANEEGFAFVKEVASITGADVAASNDLTGNIELGGDWVLEVAVGTVETQTFTLTEHGGLLAVTQQDRLNGITADFNGDGKADILRQEKGWWDDDDISTAHLLISTGNDFTTIVLPESLKLNGDYTNLYVGDFNGDGKSDLLRQEKSAWDNDNIDTAHLLISTGAGFNKIHLPENLYLHGDFNNLHIGDFNGDGKSDIVAQKKLSWDNDADDLWHAKLLISNGSGFSNSPTLLGANLQGDFTNLYVGDFNGDGKSDLLRQEKNGLDNDSTNDAHLLISNGTTFNRYNIAQSSSLNGDFNDLHIGDFNGDGKDDLLRQEKSTWDNDSNNTADLLISNGTNFNRYILPETLELKGDFTNLFVGDYNGDGKDDLLRQEKGNADNDSTNTANLLISRGNGFNKYILSEGLSIGGDYTNLYPGDFTGDGKTDLIRQETEWYNYDDSMTAQLLASNGNSFNTVTISPSSSLNGNFNNLITNNVVTKYLSDNEDDGLKFNFTYDTNVSLEQKRAFEFAGEMWSELIGDDVTVNIHVSMANSSDLPDNTLGGAVPFFHQGTSYTEFKNKLAEDIDYAQINASGNYDDETAVNNLDSGSTFMVTSPNDTNAGVWRDFDNVAMTRANAKALGFIDNDDKTLDGTIVMNDLAGTGVNWQYDYFSTNVGTSSIDFTTVAMHEIAHTLGFVSVVDGLSTDNYQNQAILNDSITALDLFRFQGNPGFRSIRTGDSASFSIDGGVTNLVRFAGGVRNIGGDSFADGHQGSHWKYEDNLGIMDPVLETNIRRGISHLDLQALDVIGWDLKFADSGWDVLASDAWNEALDTGNINRNTDIDAMLDDWRWARGGSSRRLTQSGNIAHFLAQEGFFSVGAFRSSFDFSSVDSTVEDTHDAILQQLSTAVDRFGIEVLDAIDARLNDNPAESDLERGQNQNTAVINSNDLVSTIDEWLSDYKFDEASLDKLEDLLEQPQFLVSLVGNLD